MENTQVVDYKRIFESVPGLYLILDKNFTIIAVSESYLQATLVSREGIIGKGIFTVFPDNPEDPEATGVCNLRASLNNALNNKIPETMAIQKYDVRLPQEQGGGYEERYWSPVNGLGIPAQYRKLIFERFFQMEESLRHSSGTGLGLAIVKDFVQLHQGAINVQKSALGGSPGWSYFGGIRKKPRCDISFFLA
jgi:PAS domain-containing protein